MGPLETRCCRRNRQGSFVQWVLRRQRLCGLPALSFGIAGLLRTTGRFSVSRRTANSNAVPVCWLTIIMGASPADAVTLPAHKLSRQETAQGFHTPWEKVCCAVE